MSRTTGAPPKPPEGPGVKGVIDKYLDARKSVHVTCYALCLGSLILLGLSRSPAWEVKAPFGFLQLNVNATPGGGKDAGLPTGYIPVFGPFIICGLAFWFHFSVARAMSLLRARPADIGPVEEELLVRPLQSPPYVYKRSWVTRWAYWLTLAIVTLCPIACYGMLLHDFDCCYGFGPPELQKYYDSGRIWLHRPPEPHTVVRPDRYQSQAGNYPSLEPPFLPISLIVVGVLIFAVMVNAALLLGRDRGQAGSALPGDSLQ